MSSNAFTLFDISCIVSSRIRVYACTYAYRYPAWRHFHHRFIDAVSTRLLFIQLFLTLHQMASLLSEPYVLPPLCRNGTCVVARDSAAGDATHCHRISKVTDAAEAVTQTRVAMGSSAWHWNYDDSYYDTYCCWVIADG